MEKKVLDFNSYIDHLIESKNIKKGTEQFDRIKKNVLSFKELYENELNEEDGDKDKKKDDEKIPKDPKKKLEYLVNKAVDKDTKEVKDASKSSSIVIRPWDAITDWFSAAGEPTKFGNGRGGYEDAPEDWKKRFKDRKTTMKVPDMIKCMEYWDGKMGEATGREMQAIKTLEFLSDPKQVKELIDVYWKNKTGKILNDQNLSIFGEIIDWKKLPNSDFNQSLIVEKSKILLEKAKGTFDNSGKVRRKELGFDYTIGGQNPYAKKDVTEKTRSLDDTSIGIIPGNFYDLEGKFDKGMFYDKKEATDFSLWYMIISDEDKFKKLLARFDDPNYIQTTFIKMTDTDKKEIIKGITEIAKKKFAKKDYDEVGRAVWGIYGASSILWWPTEAKEVMPETIVITQGTEGTEYEYENEYVYAWPYMDSGATGSAGATGSVDTEGIGLTGSSNPGEKMAYAYFESDRATLKKDKATAIDDAVKKIMDLIKSKNGKLTSFDYKVVASTSDEPSAYQKDGTVGKPYSVKNNEYLVVARAKVIEDELRKAIKKYLIDEELVTKSPDLLTANNTLGGTAVYEKMKHMRKDHGADAKTDAEYRKIFAEPKHSGILFNVKYTTIEKGGTPPTEEETEVTEYEVTGEWLYEIKWAGDSNRKKRRRRSKYKKAYRGINWGALFPDIPMEGLGVKDMCCAYGKC